MHLVPFMDITSLLRSRFYINQPKHVFSDPNSHHRSEHIISALNPHHKLEHVISELKFVHHDAWLSTICITHLHIDPSSDRAFHLHKLCIPYAIILLQHQTQMPDINHYYAFTTNHIHTIVYRHISLFNRKQIIYHHH